MSHLTETSDAQSYISLNQCYTHTDPPLIRSDIESDNSFSPIRITPHYGTLTLLSLSPHPTSQPAQI